MWWDERGDTPGVSRYARGVRGLAIAVVCLLGCSPNEFGQGPGGEPMTTSSESSSSGTPATTTGDPSSTTAVASTSSTTVADGTSTAASTEGSSSTTGPVLACGESLEAPEDCGDGCSQCNAGQCLIYCGGGGGPPCTKDTVTCPADGPCRVECSGNDSCRDATIVCPPEHDCTVRCLGAACGNVDVMCGAGPCSLSCITSSLACEGAQFHCGGNDSTITCNTPQDSVPEVIPSESGTDCECSVADNC